MMNTRSRSRITIPETSRRYTRRHPPSTLISLDTKPRGKTMKTTRKKSPTRSISPRKPLGIEITNNILDDFGMRHFTYINQIFGDGNVREILQTIYPNPKYKFKFEDADESFEGAYHHILVDPKTEYTLFCPVKTKIQNPGQHKNDTLCQSYTLLKYMDGSVLGEDKPKGIAQKKKYQKIRQMEMIKMYRKILANPKFKEEMMKLIQEFKTENRVLFRDIYKAILMGKKNPEDTNISLLVYKRKSAKTLTNDLIKKIHEVLDDWENYGYAYFVMSGDVSYYREDLKK